MSKQMDLFGHQPSGKARGWYRYKGRLRYPIYKLEPEGWTIRHAGHATANHPYYVITPAPGDIVVSANGRGFNKLKDAKMAVEAYLAGLIEITEPPGGGALRLMWEPWKSGPL